MSDPIKSFLTLKKILERLKKGQGRTLGHIPWCVSTLDEIREQFEYLEDNEEELDQKDKELIELQRLLVYSNAHTKSYCCGSIDIQKLLNEKGYDKLGIKFRSENGFKIDDITNIDLQQLKQLATPSGFGDLSSQTTVVDESVRKAVELKADFALPFATKKDSKHHENFDVLAIEHFENAVKERLTGHKVDLYFHKLNIYEEGGHFKPHVDTPRHGSDMLGTFVVTLPYPHSGGELIINDDTRHTFRSDTSSTNQLQWCAFFGDCVHEVRPVTSGSRVSLTFDIVRKCDAVRCNCKDSLRRFSRTFPGRVLYSVHDETVTQHYRQLLLDALNKFKSHGNEKIGILLRHRYALGTSQPSCLKGIDAQLYQIISSYYPKCKLTTVIHSEGMKYYDCSSISEGYHSTVWRLTHTDYEHFLNSSNYECKKSGCITFMPINNSRMLSKKHREGAEYTGNEALATKINVVYFDAALIIKLDSCKRQKTA